MNKRFMLAVVIMIAGLGVLFASGQGEGEGHDNQVKGHHRLQQQGPLDRRHNFPPPLPGMRDAAERQSQNALRGILRVSRQRDD